MFSIMIADDMSNELQTGSDTKYTQNECLC